MQRRTALLAAALIGLSLAGAGCGGSSGSPAPPTIAAARSFQLQGLPPASVITPGKPVALDLKIVQPDGTTLTAFKTGSGPHTGVHLIIVRDDLSSIIHRHPAIAADGSIRQTVVLPSAGRYRMLVDVYPAAGGVSGPPNFQLHQDITVPGAATVHPPGASVGVVHIKGFKVAMAAPPVLKTAEPAFLVVRVTDAAGRAVTFTPWYGATAHAIFFRFGSLDYFHTHVCNPGDKACSGTSAVVGAPAGPGVLRVGVLLPLPGTWRLFLQFIANGSLVTAPFTLHVR